MKNKTFTTSMNRKVCWEDGYKKGRQEREKEILELIDKMCYCKTRDGTFYSKTKDGKQYCAFCWLKQKLKEL